MLKGIPNIISPELLKILCEMGHGDEIVFADANFPAQSIGQRVIRADGHDVIALLSAVLNLINLDTYAENNALLMEVVKGDNTVSNIWESIKEVLKQDNGYKISHIERFSFYERAKKAYAILATGEKALYANIILKKGVICPG